MLEPVDDVRTVPCPRSRGHVGKPATRKLLPCSHVTGAMPTRSLGMNFPYFTMILIFRKPCAKKDKN